MKFRIACVCGKLMSVSSENTGRKGRCPTCKTQFVIPRAPLQAVGDDLESVDAEAFAEAFDSQAGFQTAVAAPDFPAQVANSRTYATASPLAQTLQSSLQNNTFHATASPSWSGSSRNYGSGGQNTNLIILVAVALTSVFLVGLVCIVGAIYLMPQFMNNQVGDAKLNSSELHTTSSASSRKTDSPDVTSQEKTEPQATESFAASVSHGMNTSKTEHEPYNDYAASMKAVQDKDEQESKALQDRKDAQMDEYSKASVEEQNRIRAKADAEAIRELEEKNTYAKAQEIKPEPDLPTNSYGGDYGKQQRDAQQRERNQEAEIQRRRANPYAK